MTDQISTVETLRRLWAQVEKACSLKISVSPAIANFNKVWFDCSETEKSIYLMVSYADMSAGAIPDRRPKDNT